MKLTFIHYPISIIVIIIIGYLSFFTPPQPESLTQIPNIDKLVHLCMYGGLTISLWFEYLRQKKTIHWASLFIECIVAPILLSGCIEILQATCTKNRSGDWLDFAANCLGIGLASIGYYYIIYPLHKQKRENK